MDFSNKNLWILFEYNGETFHVTQSILSTWLVMLVLILFAIIVRVRLRSFKSVPTGFQNAVETMVELASNFTKATMGARLEMFGGYFFTVFLFILLSNYCGLLGLRPPTADIATTAALAVSTLLLTQATGISIQRSGYLKWFISPHPVFLPINIVGEISKTVSLTFRLFGNILAGVIITGLIYRMLPLALRFVFPGVIHIYFDVFVGALQAFIFTVLSMTFIAQKAL